MAKTTTRRIRHGQSTDVEYSVWEQMNSRCNSHSNPAYSKYGGRGIKVCDQWKDYTRFKKDMGVRPVGMTLDRINNNGNYEPSNCRWTDWITQQNNRNNNHKLTLGDKTQGISQWARDIGVNRTTLYMRLKYGWSIEEALIK